MITICEIAVFDPEQAGIEAIHQIAYRFNEEQGDGLGIVAVKDHGDHFEYATIKSTDPHWQTFFGFLRRHRETTWRFILHGRASTTGDVNRDAAHPIHVDCEKCSIEWVVHNGHVTNHANIMNGMTGAGHEFNTEVDSEIIAHRIGDVPDDVDDHRSDQYNMSGNLSYLVLSEDGILVRVQRKYYLSDNFTMTCSYRDFDEPEDLGFERGSKNEWLLAEPGGNIEIKTRTYTGNSGTSSGVSSRGSKWSQYDGIDEDPDARWGGEADGHPQEAEAADVTGALTEAYRDDSKYIAVYEDLAPGSETVSVVKIAPGILKQIHHDEEAHAYIFEVEDERLYEWYNDGPDSVDFRETVEEESITSTEAAVRDAAEIEEEVFEMLKESQEPLHNAIV